MWSDSQIFFQWLQTTKPLKKFIANCVKASEVIALTHDNSADMLSREINSTQLNTSRLFPKMVPIVDPQLFVEHWST